MRLLAGVVQMVSGFDLDENLGQADRLIQQLAMQNARLILLPENCFMFSASAFLGVAQSDTQQAQIDTFLSSRAKLCNCYLVAGSLPVKSPADGKVFSASRVYDPNGVIIAEYHKIHLFDVDVADTVGRYRESDTIEPGLAPVCFDMDGVKVGMSICYDLRFPELYRQLCDQGCQVLLVPAAFTQKTGSMHWETLLKSRAIENQCFVLAADQGGEHVSSTGKSRMTFGHSMCVGPSGEVISQLTTGEGVCSAELDFSSLEKVRSAMPVLSHRRLMS